MVKLVLTYDDDSVSPLAWTDEKRKLLEESLPEGVGWFHCECKDRSRYCEHYLGMAAPYWLCQKCSKEGYVVSDYNEKPFQLRRCECCVLASGLYY